MNQHLSLDKVCSTQILEDQTEEWKEEDALRDSEMEIECCIQVLFFQCVRMFNYVPSRSLLRLTNRKVDSKKNIWLHKTEREYLLN